MSDSNSIFDLILKELTKLGVKDAYLQLLKRLKELFRRASRQTLDSQRQQKRAKEVIETVGKLRELDEIIDNAERVAAENDQLKADLRELNDSNRNLRDQIALLSQHLANSTNILHDFKRRISEQEDALKSGIPLKSPDDGTGSRSAEKRKH